VARIVIGGFQAEINSFYPRKTAYADFADLAGRPHGRHDPVSLEQIRQTNWGIGGFTDEAVKLGHDLVPTTWAFAQPAAELTDQAFDTICGEITDGIAAALPRVDAIYLCLHGAMVTESYEDGDGEILRRIRACAGDIPVVATLDLHANVTAQMVELATALIVYRTYPHIDMAESGRAAARLLDRILRTGRAPAKAWRQIPFLIPPVWQCTTIEPARSIYAALAARQVEPVVSLSFAEGFPGSDIHDCGPAVLAYADDAESAERAANGLHDLILSREADFAGRVYTPAAAIREAARLYDGRPIILADTQDNPGGGGGSDTTGILHALAAAGVEDAALAILYDPAAAAAAQAAGIGAELDIALGAKLAEGREAPFAARFVVEAVSDGNVPCQGAMLRGQVLRLGPTALLRTDGIRIVVASARMQPYDQEVFRHLGLDPRTQRLLVLKSSVHFRDDFEAIAGAVLVVDSPGFNVIDHRLFPYKRLRPDVRIAPLGPVLAELRQHG
jgi:microcystin degradation protein MlrC